MSMSSKHVSGTLILVSIAVLGGATYFLYRNKRVSYARTILKFGGNTNYAWLLTAEEGYLKSWADAIKKGSEVFSYNGKNYNTRGGKAVA